MQTREISPQVAGAYAAHEARRRNIAKRLVQEAELPLWRRYVDRAAELRASGVDPDEVVELLRNQFGKAA